MDRDYYQCRHWRLCEDSASASRYTGSRRTEHPPYQVNGADGRSGHFDQTDVPVSFSVALPEQVNCLHERGLREGVPLSPELQLVDDQVVCIKELVRGETQGINRRNDRGERSYLLFSRQGFFRKSRFDRFVCSALDYTVS